MNIRKYFNADKIVGTSAFIISLGTFVALLYQTAISHEQAELNRNLFKISQQEAELNRKALCASMLPHLSIYNTWLTGHYELILENNGLGPAFIQQISVTYEGKTYEGDQNNFLKKTILPSQGIDFLHTNISEGMIIPSGRKISLVTALAPKENSHKLDEIFGEEKARIDIVYSSLYDEKWKIQGMNPPKRIK